MKEDLKLTTDEAKRPIEMLKETLTDNIHFPDKRQKEEFQVKGSSKHDIFTISIYRGAISATKYNFNAFIAKNGIMLLELHVGDTLQHMNPGGEKISGSHWHIYSEEFGRAFAYKACDINSSDFMSNTLLFFREFNIIKPPEVYCQEEVCWH